jgi:F-type H+-transporting ATPase subunit gamma
VPNLKDIKRRIGSVQKTQQITRAMRMVAGAKLRRAQEATESGRPYAERMRETLGEVARAQKDAEHPLLQARDEVRNVEFVIVSSDRGLCGGFNHGVCKHSDPLIAERRAAGQGITITTAGKKARDYYKRRFADRMGGDYPQETWVAYGQAVEIAKRVSQRFEAGEVDEVVLVYNEFVTTMTQTPRHVRLLPFTATDGDAEGGEGGSGAEGDEETLPYEIEPSPEALLKVLVPRAVEIEIFRALLENQAGEHAARMTAMESATRNTEELIESLTLQYNRARQAAITKELVEIVSGAEAL